MFNISVDGKILTTGEYLQHERNRDIEQLGRLTDWVDSFSLD